MAGAAGMSSMTVFATIQHLFSTIPSWWTIAITAARFVSVTGYLFYDSLMYLVLRSTCQVLVWYVRAQRKAFHECGPAAAGETALATLRWEQPTSFKIDSVRQNMLKIREIKSFINVIWNPALSLSSALLLWIQCITFYAPLRNSVMRLDVCLSILYAWYVSISFLELAFISQTLSDEAQKLRESIRATMTVNATGDYLREVQHFHDTIDPEGLCINGAGFFRLSKPLIVTLLPGQGCSPGQRAVGRRKQVMRLQQLCSAVALVLGNIHCAHSRIHMDPDASRNVSELITSKGYPVEEHEVRTEDGYLLRIQRIPHGRLNDAEPTVYATGEKTPVLLMHGTAMSSTDFVLNFPHQSLGFLLADAGYDVWLGNFRGNVYTSHILYTRNNPAFWNFSNASIQIRNNIRKW
ncbi:hypothetical protein V5799_007702 [Amblyomma americanum]|uniref:Partial AB-hydrolase lipase domain-containing protein n=1 Tax=Amblyomma americanum TaxID=6943 RepID=A0AAQ4FH22_AMBAM